MSRTSQFADLDNSLAKDAVEILDQVGVSVTVYRQQPSSGAPGFDSDLPGYTIVKNITAYLKPRIGLATRQVNTEAGRVSETEFIGITQNRDVRIGDLWRLEGVDYYVNQVDYSFTGKVEVLLTTKV